MNKIENSISSGVIERKDRRQPSKGMGKFVVPDSNNEVYKIVSEKVRDGMVNNIRETLKPEEKELWDGMSGKLLQYLKDKYQREIATIEKAKEPVLSDQEAPRGKNMYLFDFFSQGEYNDNIFKLDAILKEKTGTGIDFRDPGLWKLGALVMGTHFQNYMDQLYMENVVFQDHRKEKEFMDAHQN